MRHFSRVGLPCIKYPFIESKLAQHASYATAVDNTAQERPHNVPRLPCTYNKESYQNRMTHYELANEVLRRIQHRYKPSTQNAPQRQLTKSEVQFGTNEYESKPTVQKYTGTAEIIETDTRKPLEKRNLNSYAARASNVSLSSSYNPQKGNRAPYHTDRTTKSDMTRSRYKYVSGYVESSDKHKDPSTSTSFECPKEPYVTRLSQLLGKRDPKPVVLTEGSTKSEPLPPSFCETSVNKRFPKSYVEQMPSDTGEVKLTYTKRKLDDLGTATRIRARLSSTSLQSISGRKPSAEQPLPFQYIPNPTEGKEEFGKSDVSSSTFEGTAIPGPKRATPEDLQASALRQLRNVQQKNSLIRMQRNEQSKRIQQKINTMLQDTKIKLMNKKREAERFKKGVKLVPQIYAKSSLAVRASHLPLQPCPRGAACQPNIGSRRPYTK